MDVLLPEVCAQVDDALGGALAGEVGPGPVVPAGAVPALVERAQVRAVGLAGALAPLLGVGLDREN